MFLLKKYDVFALIGLPNILQKNFIDFSQELLKLFIYFIW